MLHSGSSERKIQYLLQTPLNQSSNILKFSPSPFNAKIGFPQNYQTVVSSVNSIAKNGRGTFFTSATRNNNFSSSKDIKGPQSKDINKGIKQFFNFDTFGSKIREEFNTPTINNSNFSDYYNKSTVHGVKKFTVEKETEPYTRKQNLFTTQILQRFDTTGKPPIFHIEKIKKGDNSIKNYLNFSLFTTNPKEETHIDLKKIKKIFLDNCLYIISKFCDKSELYEQYETLTLCQVAIIRKALGVLKKVKNTQIEIPGQKRKGRRKKYFMFTSEAKKFCIELCQKEKIGLDIASKMCNVPRKSLGRWLRVGFIRKKGCGRKIKDPEMEKNLADWCLSKIKASTYLSPKAIQKKALELSKDNRFMASKGWLEKFKRKFKIKTSILKKINEK